ncbi:hypothetical protein RJ640_028262 [Escallonia rubra]|uniref:FHA domain-containing protein n=1 Tax=Escallonia rubra TaxID=112253 RepID=A0AA88QSN9_9ASTE|nr:hypothetical protein RJ640_028262 [Escallonia rubra]
MMSAMGPPPPRNPTATGTGTGTEPEDKSVDEAPAPVPNPMKNPMGTPPPTNPSPPDSDSVPPQSHVQTQAQSADVATDVFTEANDGSESSCKNEQSPIAAAVPPYTIPPWSEPPCHSYSLEVLKDGAIVHQLDVHEKGAYMFGRVDLCDFVLEHPTISRFHAVLQFKKNGDAYIYDLGSMHGTYVNKNQVKKKVYVELHVGDVIRFGQSSRLYIFQGPSELMLPESDLKSIRNVKARKEMQDMEASLLRAKREASLADGISWGMDEDAVEENEEDVDEITWQTYKGQLTEKQEKTRDKVAKRLEKASDNRGNDFYDLSRITHFAVLSHLIDLVIIHSRFTWKCWEVISFSTLEPNIFDLTTYLNQSKACSQTIGNLSTFDSVANMKKEIDAIRAKDISQGGLTQGQQTQIARNEQRISQVVEELENLEETLNESIRESLGARGGRMFHGKKKGATEDDEEEYLSDDDEFYDRAKKKPSKQKGANQSIETADSLLDKKDSISEKMEDKRKLLLDEKNKMAPETVAAEAGDALDAYMSGLSSQLVIDKTEQLQKDMQTLQSELDKVLYLLKFADPAGEAARKRESKKQEVIPDSSNLHASPIVKQPQVKKNKRLGAEETASGSIKKQGTADVAIKSCDMPEQQEIVADATDSKTSVYTVVKPQWLGAVEKMEAKVSVQEAQLDIHESDQFVDYKDRKKVLEKKDPEQVSMDSAIENAAPGLIIRKRKQVEKSEVDEGSVESTSSVGAEFRAEDAVALLLKHSRGYHASVDLAGHDSEDMAHSTQSGRGKKASKKVLGPERPSFLEGGSEYESWVPPKGQSGDGRTSLNDRYGY